MDAMDTDAGTPTGMDGPFSQEEVGASYDENNSFSLQRCPPARQHVRFLFDTKVDC